MFSFKNFAFRDFSANTSTVFAFPIVIPTDQPLLYSSAATKYSPERPVLFRGISAI